MNSNLQKLTSALKVSDKKRVKDSGKVRLEEEFTNVIDHDNSQIQLLKGQDNNDSFTKQETEKQPEPEYINDIDTTRPLKIGTMKLSTGKKSKRKSQI